MSILIVFDDQLNPDDIDDVVVDEASIVLLPLTANWKIIWEVQQKCISRSRQDVSVVDTAHLVTEETELLRNKLGAWAGELGEKEIKGKSIKSWLRTFDQKVSTFWFGQISEKNPLKTDLFLRIVQANIVFNHMNLGRYSICLLGISDPYLNRSVVQMGVRYGVKVRILSAITKIRGIQDVMQRWCEHHGLLGQMILGLLTWGRSIIWRIQAGSMSCGELSRISSRDAMMWVTYFPYLDWELACEGIFQNTYAASLQHKFQDQGIPVIWLLLYVTIDGKSYREAVKLKKSLASHGEKMFFLEEFVSFGSFLAIAWNWVCQILVSLWLNANMSDKDLCQGLCDVSIVPIVRQLWMKSACGPDAIKNFVYFEAFKNIFRFSKPVSHCIYYCEMQGWEVALNAAAREENPALKRIAHQHSSLSVNYFPFQRSFKEMVQNGKVSDFPLPDVLACNGHSNYRFLSEVGYPSLHLVEAVRQLHIPHLWEKNLSYESKSDVLLVAGSIKYEETKAMLSLLALAFPVAEHFEIWLKGHPSLSIEEVLQDMGIDHKEAKYHIKAGRIEKELCAVKAALVPSSTVAVEALAYGCEVIVPFFSSSLPLSPLLGYEEVYHSVYKPKDLQEVMHAVLNISPSMTVEAKKDFVKNYWCLEPSFLRWEQLLQEKDEKSLRV